jgi:uncharacterized membrane protein
MRWDDEAVERIMGRLLQVGVLTAALVVLAGGLWNLIAGPHAVPDYGAFRGEQPGLRNIAEIATGVMGGNARNLIQFGILLLIATPIARVVFALIAFAMEDDRTYVVVSLLVLSVLMYGLLGQ